MTIDVGKWGYAAGVSGSVDIPDQKRVLQITAVAKGADGEFTINGGDVVPVPDGAGITIEPKGNLVAPTLVFTGTVGYFVEYVQ